MNNIFDIIGPIMVGPSSSHTAGVVRIGNVVHKMLGGIPSRAAVKFHGSFSATYKGHGSDKAIIAGLMGFQTFDERIRDSLTIAKEKNMDFSFETVNLAHAHPNTILVEAFGDNNQSVTILGESIGGGNILVRKLNGIDVEFDGQYDTLIIGHTDTPGVVSVVTNVLSALQINIAKMKLYRSQKGGDAIMIIEADEKIDKEMAASFERLPHVKTVTVIAGLGA